MPEKLLLRLKEAGARLGCSEVTVRRLIEHAGLPAVQLPSGRGDTHQLRIRATDLERWVAGLTPGGAPPDDELPPWLAELTRDR